MPQASSKKEEKRRSSTFVELKKSPSGIPQIRFAPMGVMENIKYFGFAHLFNSSSLAKQRFSYLFLNAHHPANLGNLFFGKMPQASLKTELGPANLLEAGVCYLAGSSINKTRDELGLIITRLSKKIDETPSSNLHNVYDEPISSGTLRLHLAAPWNYVLDKNSF